MAKFETVNTALYRYLINELEDSVKLAEQRVEILNNDGDYKNALLEEKSLMNDREKLNHLNQYLKQESSSSTSVPCRIEISHFDKYANKITTECLNCCQLDEDASNYYYTKSNVKLRDWRQLEEGVEYIISNLTIKRDGNKLLSVYPQERMWHELNENFDSDKMIFEMYGNKEVYVKK